MRNRKRREGESIPALAREFRRLATKAYPAASFELRETSAMESFIDALDTETGWAIHQARASTLTHAAKIATELEAFKQAVGRKHSRYDRKLARTVVKWKDTEQTISPELLEQLVAEISEAFQKRLRNPQNTEKHHQQKPGHTRIQGGPNRKPKKKHCRYRVLELQGNRALPKGLPSNHEP